MPTHEFTFLDGKASISTETGGTLTNPDWNFEFNGRPYTMHGMLDIMAAEILRLTHKGKTKKHFDSIGWKTVRP